MVFCITYCRKSCGLWMDNFQSFFAPDCIQSGRHVYAIFWSSFTDDTLCGAQKSYIPKGIILQAHTAKPNRKRSGITQVRQRTIYSRMRGFALYKPYPLTELQGVGLLWF